MWPSLDILQAKESVYMQCVADQGLHISTCVIEIARSFTADFSLFGLQESELWPMENKNAVFAMEERGNRASKTTYYQVKEQG